MPSAGDVPLGRLLDHARISGKSQADHYAPLH